MAGMAGGMVAGRYRLADVVGHGGMGRVWRGHDQLLDREVAVKELLLPDGLTAEQRHELVERAMREARAAARLSHPSIVVVHDVVLHDGKPWIIMELISGYPLDQAIARSGKLDWMQVARIGAALADALAHAHAAGIVHRDLKPANVLLSGSRVVITDFGIARILDASLRLTSSAVIVGTPQYMPPEQLDGNPVKTPGDMWALGATLFAAVEGHPPFDGPSLSAVWAAILTRPLPAPQHAGPLGPVLADLMSKVPDQRPEAHTAAARLTALQSYTPTSRDAPGSSAAGPVIVPAKGAADSRPPRTESLPAQPQGSLTLPVASHSQLVARYVRTLDGYHSPVYTIGFSPDGHLLATRESRGELKLWDTTADIPPRSLTLSPAGYSPVIGFSPSGNLIAVSTDAGATVQLLEAASGLRQRVLGISHDRSHRHEMASIALSFTADGRRLAAFCADEQEVWLWDSVTGQSKGGVRLKAPVAELLRPKRDRNVHAAMFSPGMGLLAIHNYSDTVHLWDPLSGRRQRSITGDDLKVMTIAFRGDGRVLAARSTDDTIRLWDCGTGENFLTFKGSRSSIMYDSQAFDFSDRLVATADSPDIQIWDSVTGRHLQKLSPPERGRINGQITCLAFSPEGRLLAAGESRMKHAGGSDVFPTVVHLWEMATPLEDR